MKENVLVLYYITVIVRVLSDKCTNVHLPWPRRRLFGQFVRFLYWPAGIVPFGSFVRNNDITYSRYVLTVRRGVQGRARGGGSLEFGTPLGKLNGGKLYYILYIGLFYFL